MATRTVPKRLVAHLTIVAVLASLVTVFVASPALAGATLLVTDTDDDMISNGDCTLREAIETANTDVDVDSCVDSGTLAAGDADTITFDDEDFDYVIDFTAGDENEDSNLTGDYDIIDDLTIVGGDVDDTIIDGGGDPGNYTCGGTGSPTDRVFHVHSGTLELTDLTVQNGIIEDYVGGQEFGGGIFVNGGSLALDNARVRDNVVCDDAGEDAGGGGIAALGGDVTLFESTVEDNLAESNGGTTFGGGLDLSGATFDIDRSTIANNVSTDGQGGGLWADDTGNIVNSTFSDNEGETGGGIFYDTSSGNTLEIDYTTITDSGDVGADDNDDETGTGIATNGGTGVIEIQRSIVADQNDDGNDCFLDETNDLDSLGYNLSENDTCEFDDTTDENTANIILDALSLDGPTEVHVPDPDSENVDFIDENDCDDVGDPDEDQRGEDRPDESGENCDSGSVELTDVEKDDTGSGGGGAADFLDVTPETATNIIPGDLSHTLTATYDEDELDTGDEDDINFKIISGPNADGGSEADFQCTLSADSCTASYTSNGDEGTDLICAWNDLDGDDDYSVTGASEDGGSCDSETLSGGTNSVFTDVVEKVWEEQGPECDDGVDNDSDGDTDFPDDPGCSSNDDDSESPNPTTPPPTDTECNDGADNDSDGDVDYPNDEGCVGLEDDTENSDGPDNVVRRFGTLLTIEFGNRRNVFRGQALSQRLRCVRNREVRLKHVDPGPNTFVGSDLTDRQGDWRVRLGNPSGRYYAVATRKTFTARNGDLIVCQRDRSRTLRV